MKKMRKMMATLLALTIVFGATVPVNAAKSTDVMIAVEETNMDKVSITVPATLPIVFNEDGTNTVPTNWTIDNHSKFATLYIASVQLDAKDSGWELLMDTQDVSELPADTKAMKLLVGADDVSEYVYPNEGMMASAGRASFSKGDISIASEEHKTMYFSIERGAFTTSQPSAKAFEMVITFGFN